MLEKQCYVCALASYPYAFVLVFVYIVLFSLLSVGKSVIPIARCPLYLYDRDLLISGSISNMFSRSSSKILFFARPPPCSGWATRATQFWKNLFCRIPNLFRLYLCQPSTRSTYCCQWPLHRHNIHVTSCVLRRIHHTPLVGYQRWTYLLLVLHLDTGQPVVDNSSIIASSFLCTV